MEKFIKYMIAACAVFQLVGCATSLTAVYRDSCNSLDYTSYKKSGGLERFIVENGDTKCESDDKYGAERIMERAERQSNHLSIDKNWIFSAKIKFIQLGKTRNIFNQIHAGGYKVVPPFWIGAVPNPIYPEKVDLIDMQGGGYKSGAFEFGEEHDLRILYNFLPQNILNVTIFVDDVQVYKLTNHVYTGSSVYSKYGIYRFHYSYQTIGLDDSIVEFRDVEMKSVE